MDGQLCDNVHEHGHPLQNMSVLVTINSCRIMKRAAQSVYCIRVCHGQGISDERQNHTESNNHVLYTVLAYVDTKGLVKIKWVEMLTGTKRMCLGSNTSQGVIIQVYRKQLESLYLLELLYTPQTFHSFLT